MQLIKRVVVYARRMVKKLCLGIEIAESEDEEFCIVDTM